MINTLKNWCSGKNLHNHYKKFYNFICNKLVKLRNLVDTNYQLGLHHLKSHNMFDAELRFRIVLYLQSDHVGALYNLAKCLFIKNKGKKALHYLNKALQLKPGYQEAEYLLEMITNKQSVKIIPSSIVEEYFNDYAHKYDEDHNAAKGYKVPVNLLGALEEYLNKNHSYSVLDVGCGTGQCGLEFIKAFATFELYGLDISQNMLHEAAKCTVHDIKAYKLLIHQNYHNFLLKTKSTYDVILAGLSLHYQISFANILKHMAAILNKHGHIAFAVEKSTEDKIEAGLNDSFENFYYSEAYVKHEIVKADLKLLKIEQVGIKNNKVAFVCICVK